MKCAWHGWIRGFAIAALWAVYWCASERAQAQQRTLGLDISAWQGNVSQSTWNNIRNVENRDFVFIRSSRGGTTGFYNQSDPDNNNGLNTLSQRYDDPYFVQNITRATAAGMFAGSYHFSRPDVVATTQNSGGIANTGTDEANHFIQMAGAWMRPGYLLPVFDLEAGQNERSANELAQFCIDFSNTIYEATGVRPVMYINGNYSNYLQGASTALRTQLVSAFPALWDARYAYQNPNHNSSEVQFAHPKDTYSGFYGPWDDSGVTHPWAFWQYASTGRLQSYNNGNSNLDFDVAQGGVEFVKDYLVPALWMNDSSGEWTSLANWNSGQTPVAPVQGPGQVPRVGSLTLPAVRLPRSNDTVILDRPNANITVTLASGTHSIRKLYVREALNLTGGSLTVNYVPSADSTPIAAQFSAPVTLDGNANLSVHTLQVDATQTLTIDGGALTFNTINLMPHSTSPAKITMTGDVSFTPLAGAMATIANGVGTGSLGRVDLGGGGRTFDVANGAAVVDLAINVPIVNGALTKSGDGMLALNGANSYGGDTSVLAGKLSVGSPVLADAADLFLSTGATLNLNFAGSPDIIDSLFFDGIPQTAGIWGADGSGAQFTSPLISGTGMLQVTTFIPPLLPGDYNDDGTVDAADYVVWRNRLGSEESLPNDDTPGVAQDDFDRWRANFGPSLGAGSNLSSLTAVPEPVSISLLVIACGALYLARCRHRPPSRRRP